MASQHTKGLALGAFAALLFSTPGLFTKGASAGGWEVIFWRGVFGALFVSIFMAWRGTLRKDMSQLGWSGWICGLIWASGTIAYLQALKLSTIANVTFIYGSVSLMAALIAWTWFKERPRNIVLAASVVAFIGVMVIARGSAGSINFTGDLLALYMTFTVALCFALFRKYPETPTAGTTVLASLLAVPPCLVWGHPFTVSTQDLVLLAAFGFVFSIAGTFLTAASKLLPAGETALLSNLEIPIAPTLAWLVFAELPPRATFIGGMLVLVAIGVSSWRAQVTDENLSR